MLTWLQAAVEVEDTHKETAETQGKDHLNDFVFPHPEGRGWAGGGRPGAGPTPVGFPATNYLDSVCFITDKSIDPAR